MSALFSIYHQYQLRIAELYEECRNYEDAITAYRDAARFFTAEMMTQEVGGNPVIYLLSLGAFLPFSCLPTAQ